MTDNSVTPLNPIEDDEITLKELILKVKEYAKEIRRNWWVLVLFILPISAYMLNDAYNTKRSYKANLTFIVNDDKGASLGLSAALGGLGDLAGGAGSKLDKIIELSKSRRILQTALFRTGKIDGITDFYANHLIRDQELHKKWEKDTTGLKGFFYKKGDVDSFSRVENKVLLALQEILVGKIPLFLGSFEKKSEIMKLALTTNNEELSIDLLRSIYVDLSAYYIDKSISKERKTYNVFKSKADSLRNIAISKDRNADQYEDNHRGSLFLEDRRESDRYKKDALLYSTLYGETQKNLNLAGFALESKLPYIQDIDMPIAPIKPEIKSKKMALIIGFALGGFLGAIVVILRKILREAMA
jgi:hypothetical protein